MANGVMKIIGGCIFILLFLTMISVISGNDFITTSITESYNLAQTLDGEGSELGISIAGDFALGDPLTLAVVWIIVIGAIAVVAGLAVLGSGLNEGGARWLVYMIFFIAVWTMFSTFPFPMIVAIQEAGVILYLLLTMIYAVSCILWIGGVG